MTRREFMRELASLLSRIPEDERKDALQYYEDYFTDAGIYDDMLVPSSIGTPQQVADTIIRETVSGNESQHRENVQEEKITNQTGNKQSDNSRIIIAIVLVVVLSPLWIGIVSSVATLMFGIFCALVGIVICLGLTGIALIISAFLSSGIAGSILLAGTGIFILGLGILCVIPLVLYCTKFIPWLATETINFFKWAFGRKEQKE